MASRVAPAPSTAWPAGPFVPASSKGVSTGPSARDVGDMHRQQDLRASASTSTSTWDALPWRRKSSAASPTLTRTVHGKGAIGESPQPHHQRTGTSSTTTASTAPSLLFSTHAPHASGTHAWAPRSGLSASTSAAQGSSRHQHGRTFSAGTVASSMLTSPSTAESSDFAMPQTPADGANPGGNGFGDPPARSDVFPLKAPMHSLSPQTHPRSPTLIPISWSTNPRSHRRHGSEPEGYIARLGKMPLRDDYGREIREDQRRATAPTGFTFPRSGAPSRAPHLSTLFGTSRESLEEIQSRKETRRQRRERASSTSPVRSRTSPRPRSLSMPSSPPRPAGLGVFMPASASSPSLVPTSSKACTPRRRHRGILSKLAMPAATPPAQESSVGDGSPTARRRAPRTVLRSEPKSRYAAFLSPRPDLSLTRHDTYSSALTDERPISIALPPVPLLLPPQRNKDLPPLPDDASIARVRREIDDSRRERERWRLDASDRPVLAACAGVKPAPPRRVAPRRPPHLALHGENRMSIQSLQSVQATSFDPFKQLIKRSNEPEKTRTMRQRTTSEGTSFFSPEDDPPAVYRRRSQLRKCTSLDSISSPPQHGLTDNGVWRRVGPRERAASGESLVIRAPLQPARPLAPPRLPTIRAVSPALSNSMLDFDVDSDDEDMLHAQPAIANSEEAGHVMSGFDQDMIRLVDADDEHWRVIVADDRSYGDDDDPHAQWTDRMRSSHAPTLLAPPRPALFSRNTTSSAFASSGRPTPSFHTAQTAPSPQPSSAGAYSGSSAVLDLDEHSDFQDLFYQPPLSSRGSDSGSNSPVSHRVAPLEHSPLLFETNSSDGARSHEADIEGLASTPSGSSSGHHGQRTAGATTPHTVSDKRGLLRPSATPVQGGPSWASTSFGLDLFGDSPDEREQKERLRELGMLMAAAREADHGAQAPPPPSPRNQPSPTPCDQPSPSYIDFSASLGRGAQRPSPVPSLVASDVDGRQSQPNEIGSHEGSFLELTPPPSPGKDFISSGLVSAVSGSSSASSPQTEEFARQQPLMPAPLAPDTISRSASKRDTAATDALTTAASHVNAGTHLSGFSDFSAYVGSFPPPPSPPPHAVDVPTVPSPERANHSSSPSKNDSSEGDTTIQLFPEVPSDAVTVADHDRSSLDPFF